MATRRKIYFVSAEKCANGFNTKALERIFASSAVIGRGPSRQRTKAACVTAAATGSCSAALFYCTGCPSPPPPPPNLPPHPVHVRVISQFLRRGRETLSSSASVSPSSSQFGQTVAEQSPSAAPGGRSGRGRVGVHACHQNRNAPAPELTDASSRDDTSVP